MAKLATRDEQEALDIVQEAMYKLVQKYSNKTKEEWPGYYYRILHNKINDWHRREKVRNRWRVFFTPRDESDSYKIEDNTVQTTLREPEENYIGDVFSHEILTAVEGLPHRQRQALIFRIWEGFSVAETADIMGCSEGSVKTHLSRAVHRLREELDDPFVDRIFV